jgi:CheY-like chemotaxis protein
MTYAPGTDDSGTPPSPRLAAGSAVHAGADLAGAIGDALGPPMEQAHAIVQEFLRSGRISRAQLLALGAAVEDGLQVAQQSRQLALLDSPPRTAMGTPQRLDILVSQALARQMPSLQQHRITVRQQTSMPVWVAIEPALLQGLIDAAIACCMRPDHRLAVSIDASGDTGLALLRLRLHADDAAQAGPDARQGLSWHLLDGLARTAGARLTRQAQGREAVLTLGLQQIHDVAADPLPGDLLTSQDSLVGSATVPLQHQRVLLITRHDVVRQEVEHVCESLGALVDWVATGTAAQRQFAQTRADLVLVDARNIDAATQRLHQELQAAHPEIPWIEIAQDAASVSLTQWMREDSLTLHNLRSQLASTLLYGLSRVNAR